MAAPPSLPAGPASSRRALLQGGLGLALSLALVPPGSAAAPGAAADALAALEAESGGRIGLAVLDTGSGRLVGHRLDERFAMCSAFKALLGGVILCKNAVELGILERSLPIPAADLVVHSPVTGPAAGTALTVDQLCAATIATSDNTAANLLLELVGGPAGFTAALRALGDPTTRLDRREPALNENRPGDPRDSSTPRAFAQTLAALLFGPALAPADQARLQGWMAAATTGRGRLRAGLPPGWPAGDKTGTSERDQSNDVAFVRPPEGPPLVLVSFLNVPAPLAADAVHAEAARRLRAALAATN